MIADGSSLPSLKRKRLPAVDSLDTQAAAAKVRLAIKKSSGEIFVCLRRFSSTKSSVQGRYIDFYKLNAEDNTEILAARKEAEKFLKMKKIQEAEESAHKSRTSKVVIRVRFPDKHTLEVAFHSKRSRAYLIFSRKSLLDHNYHSIYVSKGKAKLPPSKGASRKLSEDFELEEIKNKIKFKHCKQNSPGDQFDLEERLRGFLNAPCSLKNTAKIMFSAFNLIS